MVLRIAPEAPAVEMLSSVQRRFLAELALASAVAGEPITIADVDSVVGPRLAHRDPSRPGGWFQPHTPAAMDRDRHVPHAGWHRGPIPHGKPT